MDLATTNVVATGVIAIVVGGVVLLAMVRYDLGPRGRLARGGQWLLATALGTGILAFAFKLLMIVAVVQAPEVMIAPLIAKAQIPPPPPAKDPFYGAFESRRYVWQPLPAPGAAEPAVQTDYVWQALPTAAPVPADNPMSAEKIALGERLFFDPNLSRDRKSSCATCHQVREGSGADGRATSVGIDGQIGQRNAPTVWNAAFQSVLFWDGRSASLEEQAKGPLVNPVEMGMPSLAAVEERVKADAGYRESFAEVFPGQPITIDRIVQAIAAYERTLITPDTPYDRFVRGDLEALTPAQLRGMGLFQSLGCVTCHSGPNFSAASQFDGKAPLRIFPAFPVPYEERYRLTEDSGAAPKGSGRGLWRVPSLRNVALTGPYFHNGSVTDLAEAVRVMASSELGRTGRYLVWSPRTASLTRLDKPALSDREVDDIVAFLHALTSDSLAEQVKRWNAQREEITYASSQ
ncbi:MAG: cytochrome c peroxidase [Hydrogenophaga sp.]|nr:c-type cytochrome [Gammaproteobacteria bacterium]